MIHSHFVCVVPHPARRRVGALAIVMALLPVAVPVAAADPLPGLGSADAVIDQLREQGYDVAINWVAGNSTYSLSDCRVAAVHNPNRQEADPGTFTTVYVDVACPGREAPVGIEVGIGF